jgi:hypothetical protein
MAPRIDAFRSWLSLIATLAPVGSASPAEQRNLPADAAG